MGRTNVTARHYFNGLLHHTTRHNITSIRGLAKILNNHGTEYNGWGVKVVWDCLADARKLGAYKAEDGNCYIRTPEVTCAVFLPEILD